MPEITDWARMEVTNSGTGTLNVTPVADYPSFTIAFGSGATSMYYTARATGYRERGVATYTGSGGVSGTITSRAPSRTWSAAGGFGTTAPLALPSGTLVFCAIGEDELNAIDAALAAHDAALTALDARVDALEASSGGGSIAQQRLLGRAVGAGTGPAVALTPTQIRAVAEITEDDGIIWASVPIGALGDDVVVATGVAYIPIPESFSNFLIHRVVFDVYSAGSGGTTEVQVSRDRGGTVVSTLSTRVSIDSGEKSSLTAATPYVINTANDDLLTGDRLRIDVAVASTTKAKGGIVTIGIKTA